MSAIHLETRPDSVAVLTFDQPHSKANVLTRELLLELDAVLDSLAPRTDLMGLVLSSAKPGIFIAGADLKIFENAPGPNDPAVRELIEHGLRVLEKLEALPFPTCAAIDGAALGGGLEVALACDYRVCGTNPKVQLGLPEVTLGIIPGLGGTQRLPRVVGWNVAGHMLVSGASLLAANATAVGLCEHEPRSVLIEDSISVVKHGTFDRATKLQSHWRHDWPFEDSTFTPIGWAAEEAIRVMIEGESLPLYDAIKLETDAFMRLVGTAESKRLIAAFFASRKR